MSFRFARVAKVATAVAGFLASGLTHASIVIDNTRVVYRAAEAEATVRLTNSGRHPSLAQVWIDDGDATASPASADAPFVVTPPIARIDPDKGQTLRIVYTGEPLPDDRESLFYLNVLEVPPRPTGEAAQGNLLQMAFRTRLKLFFRPASLPDAAAEAPTRVTWRVTGRAVDGDRGLTLEATNPTPYHVTLIDISLAEPKHAAPAPHRVGGMLGPGASRQFRLEGVVRNGVDPAAGTRVRFGAINDQGGTWYGEASVQ
ncbi:MULTISPECIES: fimbrial biogenesis chaperone [Cupriavidus]|jgi:fimbrial chaperone protein/chaperone protein EcpD|uniref:Fimbria/pilus periplasmic chaperone n=1 Tax=Cupriavidus pauculus TaxID=82633 RepID=A0A5P2H153_9BURK|nr:fimbria/pilus periplasmic chaperone [Cupriavidus pauculus]QET01193.1 fimbria/pilus periplasmic chaperone [Cupriavidus pauculus]